MPDEIQVIGDWNTNGEMIADVAQLGFIEGSVLDLTYGQGGFWTDWEPELDVVKNDLDPDSPAIFRRDFRATGWLSRSFGTVVFDPPYKLAGTPASPEMDKRYGTDIARTRHEIHSLLVGGMAEGARLTDKFLLVKCMDQVNSGQVRWQTDIAVEVARALELRKVACFMLGGGRKQPEGKRQIHPRHEYSTLLVFKKGR